MKPSVVWFHLPPQTHLTLPFVLWAYCLSLPSCLSPDLS